MKLVPSYIVLGAALILAPLPALASDAPLKIGFISTLSGPSAIHGQETLDGFNLALERLGGTLGGRAVELVLGDDQQKPDVARQLADRMVERDRVDLVTGTIWSNEKLGANIGTVAFSPTCAYCLTKFIPGPPEMKKNSADGPLARSWAISAA